MPRRARLDRIRSCARSSLSPCRPGARCKRSARREYTRSGMRACNKTFMAAAAALIAAAAAFAGALWTAAARAEEYPSRPVHLIVPFPPGGPLDISGRLIAQTLQQLWKQPVIVENKPGSTIGTEALARSPADGYSLMIISSTPLLTLPHLQRVPYDVLRDFAAVCQTTLLTYVLVVNPGAGIGSLQDLLDQARRSPGRLNYA